MRELSGLRAAVVRYPKCRVANCDCDETKEEWKKGCGCMGHFTDMDRLFGKDDWTLKDFTERTRA